MVMWAVVAGSAHALVVPMQIVVDRAATCRGCSLQSRRKTDRKLNFMYLGGGVGDWGWLVTVL